MNRTRIHQALLVAVIGSVAIVGCKKKEEAAPAPAPTIAEPAPAPVPTPAPAPTASVTTVDLGNAAGPDMKLTAMSASFKPKNKIIASVGTSTSDPAASVAGKLTAKWTYMDASGAMPVSEESKDFNFAGAGLTNFEVSKPDGWPVGKYKVEILLDGAVVQTKDFEVTK
jgi:hypothetical protein